MTRDLLLVATGGALGAMARYLAARAATFLLPATFPWGTAIVNVTGCLAMGLVAGLSSQGAMVPSTRLFLATGILGGYTTFSAFSRDTVMLAQQGRWGLSAAYAVLSVVLSVGACALGSLLSPSRAIG